MSVICGSLKKFIRRDITSTIDATTATGQTNIELASISSFNVGVNANEVEVGVGLRSSEDTTRNKLFKLEKLIGSIMQRLDNLSQRVEKCERK